MLLVPGLTEEWLAIAPLRTGNKPVYNCCLVGEHMAVAVKAWVKMIPSLASLSMFGVLTSLLP